MQAERTTTVREKVDPLNPFLPLYCGEFSKTVRVGERERGYIVYIPDGARESTAGIFILPQSGKSAADMLRTSGWRELADGEERKEKMILFFLEPLCGGWDTAETYGKPDGDVAYLDAVYQAGCERFQFCVHESKNYLVGYNEGGVIVQKAAMWNPAVYGGICSVGRCVVDQAYMEAARDALCTNLHGFEDFSGRGGIRKGAVPMPAWMITEPGTAGMDAVTDYWKLSDQADSARQLCPDTVEYYRTAPTPYPYDQDREAFRVWYSEIPGCGGEGARLLSRRIWKDFLYGQRRWMGNPGGDLRIHRDPVRDLGMEYHYQQVGGWMREWYVHVPEKVRHNPGVPVPLVFAMHGYTCSGEIYVGNSGWNRVADDQGFIVVFPTASYGCIGNLVNKAVDPNNVLLPAWNFLQEPGRPDELAFFRHMLEQVCHSHAIDRHRVFATGHSHGSFMTQVLGLSLPEIFAAIAPCSGVLFDLGGNQGAVPQLPEVVGRKDILTPVWMFVGEEEGWLIPSRPTNTNVSGETIALWREKNHIGPPVPRDWTEGWSTHSHRWSDLIYEKDGVPLVRYTCVDFFPHATIIEMSYRIWDEFFSRFSKDEKGDLRYLSPLQEA